MKKLSLATTIFTAFLLGSVLSSCSPKIPSMSAQIIKQDMGIGAQTLRSTHLVGVLAQRVFVEHWNGACLKGLLGGTCPKKLFYCSMENFELEEQKLLQKGINPWAIDANGEIVIRKNLSNQNRVE